MIRDTFKYRIPLYNRKTDKFDKFVFQNACDEVWYLNLEFKEKPAEQCVGVKDKRGKLIYENDFVKLSGFIHRVIWCEVRAQFVMQVIGCFSSCEFNEMWNKKIEIIGNLHENRDILEEVKNGKLQK